MMPQQWQLSWVDGCACSGDLSPGWEVAADKDLGTSLGSHWERTLSGISLNSPPSPSQLRYHPASSACGLSPRAWAHPPRRLSGAAGPRARPSRLCLPPSSLLFVTLWAAWAGAAALTPKD